MGIVNCIDGAGCKVRLQSHAPCHADCQVDMIPVPHVGNTLSSTRDEAALIPIPDQDLSFSPGFGFKLAELHSAADHPGWIGSEDVSAPHPSRRGGAGDGTAGHSMCATREA